MNKLHVNMGNKSLSYYLVITFAILTIISSLFNLFSFFYFDLNLENLDIVLYFFIIFVMILAIYLFVKSMKHLNYNPTTLEIIDYNPLKKVKMSCITLIIPSLFLFRYIFLDSSFLFISTPFFILVTMILVIYVEHKLRDNDFKTRLHVLDNISYEPDLRYIVNVNSDWQIRVAAVNRIFDDSVLADIAKNAIFYYKDKSKDIDKINKLDKHYNVSETAVRNIFDEFLLIDIVKNAYDLRISEEAVKNIFDEPILVDIAKSNHNFRVRVAAVNRLTDNGVLIDIAQNDYDWHVRVAAVNRLTDEHVLMDIVKNDSYKSVRDAAFLKIKSLDLADELWLFQRKR